MERERESERARERERERERIEHRQSRVSIQYRTISIIKIPGLRFITVSNLPRFLRYKGTRRK